MPFGRHRGDPLSTIPADYLDWLWRTVRLGRGFHAAVADELYRRGAVRPCNHPDIALGADGKETS
jgi:hypothetical protein